MGQNFPECWTEARSVVGEAHDLDLPFVPICLFGEFALA